ncbi:MAG: phosphoglucomutase/phosphomannomutase family protein [Actinomycetota bacterium]
MLKFGTDGWRAVIADEFTYANVRLVAAGIAGYLKSVSKKPTAIIGYDNRFMGREFAQAAGEQLAGEGIKVYVGEEPYPTPTIAYAVKAYGVDGAIMLTASHNPYYYNGLKFIPAYAGPATADITDAIENNIKRIAKLGSPSKVGVAITGDNVKAADLSREYVSHILGFIDIGLIRERNLTAAVDPLHGAGFRLLPELSRAAGIETVIIRDSVDPLFEGGFPDPSAKNLKRLAGIVIDKKCDAGLALDGDGDRFGIIADNGEFLSPNQVASLVLRHMVKNRGSTGAAVRTIATTHLVDKIAEDYGLELIETSVGFKHVGKVMRERPVVMGGEESGGLSVLGHIPEKDGLLADLLIMEMIAVEEKSLSDIWRGITKRYGDFLNERLDIELNEKRKDKLLGGLNQKPPTTIGGLKVKSVDKLDGLRFTLDRDAWLLARSSGTEPLIRVYIEAQNDKDFTALVAGALELISP